MPLLTPPHCTLTPYLRARHYNSALSIWLSIDPMSDKYPGLSPYTYCGNNPVVLKDPNGREIGDYFDWYGRYLGNDGNSNDNVFIVSGRIPKKSIDKTTGKVSSLGNAKIDVSTTKSVIKEAINVYDRTVANGGDDEECFAFGNNGEPYPGKRGNGGEAKLPIAEGSVSIHSHRLTERKRDGKTYINTPDFPSTIKNSGREDCDETIFRNFALNIIVGDLQPDDFSQLRSGAMTFYGRIITDSKGDMLKQPYIGTMLMDDARKIINHK